MKQVVLFAVSLFALFVAVQIAKFILAIVSAACFAVVFIALVILAVFAYVIVRSGDQRTPPKQQEES